MLKKIICILIITITLPIFSQTILYTNYQDLAPKYFVQDGKHKGICVDIIKALNLIVTQNYITIKAEKPSKPFIPFKRIQSRLLNNDIDIFVGFAKTDQRLIDYNFSHIPIYEVKSTFLKNSFDDFEFNRLSDLAGKSIGVISGSKTAEDLTEIEGIIILEINTLGQAVKMLTTGRIDLIYYHSLGLNYTVDNLNIEGIVTFTKNSLYHYYHYIAYNKNLDPNIKDEIEKALKSLKDNGVLDSILSKYQVN